MSESKKAKADAANGELQKAQMILITLHGAVQGAEMAEKAARDTVIQLRSKLDAAGVEVQRLSPPAPN